MPQPACANGALGPCRARTDPATHVSWPALNFASALHASTSVRWPSTTAQEKCMQETPQQYTQRILSHSEGKDPLRLQAAAPKKFAALLKGKNNKQPTRGPAPGKWAAPEGPAHIAHPQIV